MTWQGLWPIPYASIPQEIDDSEVDEKNRPIAKPIAQKLLWLGGLGLLVVASGFVGFSLGRAESTTLATQPELQDVVPQG